MKWQVLTMTSNMEDTVQKAHPFLYHYTTSVGLKGILESQQLRATSIAFLNDAEEHTGYFDRRLPVLLEEIATKAVAKIESSSEGLTRINKLGGRTNVIKDLVEDLGRLLKKGTLGFHKPFVTSFCGSLDKQSADDGLLSQWRGYGHDGGYAIVFDSIQMEKLLTAESTRFNYLFLTWGDVDYYDHTTESNHRYPETIKAEQIVEDAIYQYIFDQNPNSFDPIHDAIAMLSCRHKHRGFKEEVEVRIVAIPPNDDVHEEVIATGNNIPFKPIEYESRNGILIPYIELFGKNELGANAPLPIVKVIVGPHPDRLRRKISVEGMLKKFNSSATVTISDIPYIGR